MTPAARIAAAIEILGTLETHRRPAADALKDWGLTHRFAGSKDRAALAALVFDALRTKASSSATMHDASARGMVLGMLRGRRGLDGAAIAALCNGEGHAPAPLSLSEAAHLAAPPPEGLSPATAGDYPEWLEPQMCRAFGEARAAEGQALAERAPLDLRVNTLKAKRERQLAALEHLGAHETPFSPWGLRIIIGEDGRAPALAGEPAFAKGLVEVQDEGSQLAALVSGAREGMQVLDFCAGGGGKTLALAGMMGNKGQIYATDSDGRRLMPIYQRLERAGARNVQVRAPKAGVAGLSDLAGNCDIVLVDAPCTGSGTWRRNPDAKWRMRPGALEQRIKDQDETLAAARAHVKPGGLLLYVTCSLFAEENEDRIAQFLGDAPEFAAETAETMATRAGCPALAAHASTLGPGLRLSPRSTQTDGFYICGLRRAE